MLLGKKLRSIAVVAAVATVGIVGACSDSGPTLAPSQTRISIADGALAHRAAPTLMLDVSGTLVAIPASDVEKLEIALTDIAYLGTGDDENAESAWQTFSLGATVTVDLMAIPAEEAGSFLLGEADVPVGDYQKVRLMVGEGTIVFNKDVTVPGTTFNSGEAYPVTVPSGNQTGLKVTVSFEVIEDGEPEENGAYIVFEPGTTFQNVTVTGSGSIMLAPVLRAK